MNVQPRPRFAGLVRILDAINPFLILAATIGIFMDYSPLKAAFALPNDVIAALFAVDFLLRLMAFPTWRYLSRGWGWIDFLASLPGFMLVLQRTPLLALLRIVRVGRFFRIIRVLRFLRAFSFLKSMKADSTWVQDRIMKIGVSIVFTSMIGIVALDLGARAGLEDLAARPYRDAWDAGGSSLRGVEAMPGVVAAIQNGAVRQKRTDGYPAVGTPAEWAAARDDLLAGLLQIDLEPGRGLALGSVVVPAVGILVDARGVYAIHDTVMTIAIATLLGVLLVIMFVVGAVFARDVRTLQLVVDSFDAGDYLLLREEASNRGFVGEAALIDSADDEMDNLLKVSAATADQLEAQSAGWSTPAAFDEPASVPAALSDDELVRIAGTLESRLGQLLRERDLSLIHISEPTRPY